MTLGGRHLTVVTRGEDRLHGPLTAAGAIVRSMNVNELAVGLEPTLEALVLDVGADVEAFGAFVAGIPSPLQGQPVFALVDGSIVTRRIAALGPVIVLDDDTANDVLIARLDASLSSSSSADRARLEDAEARGLVLTERHAAAARAIQTLSHDVRVLCGVAMGYAANLRDGFAGMLEPAQREHVAQILSAITDVGGLFDRSAPLLETDSDAADHGPPPSVRKVTSRRTSTDLVVLAESTVRLFENVAIEKKLHLELAAPAPVRAWCDPTQIKQALTNLLVNALKFTPPGGRVTVAVGTAKSEYADATGVGRRRTACLTVRDNGHGVAPNDRERIFYRGVRAEAHAQIPGSGIGLAVVREVAVLHGGSARVDETDGGGATFVLTLPLDLRRRRADGILLVEDAAVAARIVAALVDEGLEAFEAVDGAERLHAMLGGCAAVVAVPKGRLAMLEVAAAAGDSDPVSLRTPTPPEVAPTSRRGRS